MITASYLTFSNRHVSPDFAGSLVDPPDYWGPIDAPEFVPAGSHYAYQPETPGVAQFVLCSVVYRESVA